MKLALLADIHANLEALEAVLIAVEKAGVERIISLGDVVGYGVDPVACLYRLQEVNAVCVLGNHDQAMVDTQHLRSLNLLARDTISRSRELLSAGNIEYLQSFSYRWAEFGGVFSHANPIRPEEWGHLFLFEQIVWCMERLDWQLAFVGHTHSPGIYCKMQDQVVPLFSSRVAIGRHQYLINPGSVGQPRDGDWRAAFALWDVDQHHIELCRVEYPVAQTQEKMTALDWPLYMVERLGKGE